ncbi:uncharacterized protein LOC129208290 [Grus americana]|uniref:uncharacterized protein LOC129208290 n=1 Tax=Grus americana TaxID=9117 RepID=UPI002407D8CE|nr:uncharacterized protein LOC129208290 [Grus americana]
MWASPFGLRVLGSAKSALRRFSSLSSLASGVPTPHNPPLRLLFQESVTRRTFPCGFFLLFPKPVPTRLGCHRRRLSSAATQKPCVHGAAFSQRKAPGKVNRPYAAALLQMLPTGVRTCSLQHGVDPDVFGKERKGSESCSTPASPPRPLKLFCADGRVSLETYVGKCTRLLLQFAPAISGAKLVKSRHVGAKLLMRCPTQ